MARVSSEGRCAQGVSGIVVASASKGDQVTTCTALKCGANMSFSARTSQGIGNSQRTKNAAVEACCELDETCFRRNSRRWRCQ